MAGRPSRSRRPVGRPAGQETTRAAILVAARKAFASTGYEGTSLRAIGAEADVDPSTVIHFFGTKEDLFKAVIDQVRPAIQPVAEALAAVTFILTSDEQAHTIVFGRVLDPTVTAIAVQFSDGESQQVAPLAGGFLLVRPGVAGANVITAINAEGNTVFPNIPQSPV